jgi:UDP-N-acetylglucosamine--N-acetylmuramyl-(pentapeptide) pyrophosphoryl-undecaprenol N-acetylglucosamine transferase
MRSSDDMSTDILLVGGGTAGHVLPAVATAQVIARMRPDLSVGFAGLPGSLEQRLVRGAGFRMHLIDAVPLPRRASLDLLRVAPRLIRAVRGARRVLSDESVRAVVSFGGYVALPVSLAARGRVPLVLHEQNSRPGLANRLAARFADEVAVTFASSRDRLPSDRPLHITGNPVQRRLRDLDLVARRGRGRKRLGLDPQRTTLLVFGGSQGARSINRTVAASAAAWQNLGVQVVHVSGPAGFEDAVEAWRAAGIDPDDSGGRVRVIPFLDDMADAYAAADVVIARAGATTIAELSVLGIPAVLIPYPHATADHQRGNAEALVRAGAAVMLDDADLSPETLTAAVVPIVSDPARAGAMAVAARAWSRPAAAEALALLALSLLPAPPDPTDGADVGSSSGADHA